MAGLDSGESGLLGEVGQLVETLASDYDLSEFLQVIVERSVQLFDVDAAGLLLAGASGHLQVIAVTPSPADAVALFQIQTGDGPCCDALSRGEAVLVDDVAADPGGWPRWSGPAAEAGFHGVTALPMKARGETFGALNLLSRRTGVPRPEALTAAQIFTDVAAIVVVHERGREQSESLIQQLQTALDTRVVLEQAKGVLSERAGVSLDEAFELLRERARTHQIRLAVLAADLVAGRVR